jgi:hypothetical protein
VSSHPTVTIGTNSYVVGAPASQELIARSMASHLEHLAEVLRDPASMAHMSRDEQLSYVKHALAEHSRIILETPQ